MGVWVKNQRSRVSMLTYSRKNRTGVAAGMDEARDSEGGIREITGSCSRRAL